MDNSDTAHSRKISRKKVFWLLTKATFDKDRPVLAQIVVTRRCNLSCGYCYEYDKVSKPIPIDILKKRIDKLKQLKTVFVTLNGGEPLLHPQIADLVAYTSKLGMVPMINSNGHALRLPLIEKLNAAGLFGMQLSCDALEDNDVTQKSMRRLQPKLDLLKEHANFVVRVNGVLGSANPHEMEIVAKKVVDYGFIFQCSLMRDSTGKALPLSKEAQEVYSNIRRVRKRLPKALNDNFQLPLSRGESVEWKCRAGARHFEIDPEGFVHLCQPKTGYPNKTIIDYSIDDIRQHYNCPKDCSERCPIAYAHLGSRLDHYRSQKGYSC